ncbi:hypothetical protein [Microbulbifer spongiae]|uniref:Ricin B lectin domain-containing protein n=1 Tax=Microbulbifer spongiae TaxID=2944933 RepID=A0ABY9ED51_9GAMM|nr:hypothetical protein [Microbulbifer sp. MI-G]WKD50177.1 hypothetical protein M8T91_01735 [Microbulbifer sp. MI-G]
MRSYIWVILFLLLGWTQAFAEEPKYLRLMDRLDRANDGYCFDVQGVRGHFRADKPLVAHNCKEGAAPDGLVEHNKDNMLFFPAFNQCVTAMGTGTTVLPGTSLMLKPCVEHGVFASPSMQKQFTFNHNKQLELGDSNLCVVVGNRSAQTLSSRDRWRTLFLDDCDKIPLERSQWELIAP